MFDLLQNLKSDLQNQKLDSVLVSLDLVSVLFWFGFESELKRNAFVNVVSETGIRRTHLRLVSFFYKSVSKLKPESGSNLDKSNNHVLEKQKQTAKTTCQIWETEIRFMKPQWVLYFAHLTRRPSKTASKLNAVTNKFLLMYQQTLDHVHSFVHGVAQIAILINWVHSSCVTQFKCWRICAEQHSVTYLEDNLRRVHKHARSNMV